jgi:arginyl-tRNA synthetase
MERSVSSTGPDIATPPVETEVGRAVAFAGADAVRFSLARAVPGRPVVIDRQIIARHVLGNPAYAVRYAHARAASGVRWAATSRAVSLGRQAVPRHRPADPGELVLLDALSWLPERVATAARRGRPDEFARYLEELASATIAALIGAGDPGTARVPPTGRLAMAKAAQTGLAAGLGLLGVDAPGRL